MTPNGLEVVAAGLLFFFVPGYTITKATFPEWRVRGSVAVLRLLEIIALSFVLSVALVVLAGYALLVGGPTGFQAAWSDPVLEALLAAIAAVAFVGGWFRGAYARTPPRPMATEPMEESGTWALVEELDGLRREERRVRHALRVATSGSAEETRLREELDRIRSETTRLQGSREEEYAS
jgi:hypothetical protein